MATKINMNSEEIAHFMRTRNNSWGESLMKRTTVMRRIKYFPRGSNQDQRAYVLYDAHGSMLDVIVSNAASPAYLRAELPKRITVIDDEGYLTRKEYKHYLAFRLDW